MTAVETFFNSVRESFANLGGPEAWGGLLLGAALLVLGGLAASWRSRRRAERAVAQAVRELGRRRKLTEADLSEVADLARGADVSPIVLMSSMAVFERTTAQVLAAQPLERKPSPGSWCARIARLRVALGFDVLPSHHWLLTTRELKPGDDIKVSSVAGRVAEVNEACFAVELEPPGPALEDTRGLTLEVVRANDAHYVMHCNVIEWEGTKEGRPRVLFAHDEDPERLQLREHVRVGVRRPVWLTPFDAEPPSARKPFEGVIVDVSAGGMSVDIPRPARNGTFLLCSFELADGVVFENIAAKVVASAPTAHGRGLHLRLAFTGEDDAEQGRRLVAALAWHEQKEAARQAGG